MAGESDAIRKDLTARGYQLERPTGRGRTYWTITDPATGTLVGRLPVHLRPGSLRDNLLAGIRRYERGGPAPRSNRIPDTAG